MSEPIEPTGSEPEAPVTGTEEPSTGGQSDQLGEGGTKALEAERRRARDLERASKAATRERDALKAELDKIRAANMSEQEKAVAEAETRGREAANAEARKTFGSRLVDAELKAALAGRVEDKQRTALLSRLDRTQFLTDDGEVDAKAVTEWANDVAPQRTPSFDGGQRGTPAKATGMSALIRERANR